MKLILSEYIASLKEDQELDRLVTNLLRELEVIPLTTPQRGRQYGVDIAAVGTDVDQAGAVQVLYLLAVKQGNITRSAWSTDTTGVRSTLEEIKDVYLNSFIPDVYKHLPKKIILISNGYIEQNVNVNWVSYQNANTTSAVSYDYWGNDKLVWLIEKAQFSETLFPDDVRSLLRKSLVLMDLPDYDYSHYYELLVKLLPEEESRISKKEAIKKFRLINSCLAIVYHWSKGYNNVKPALVMGERTLVNAWAWLQKNSFGRDVEVVQEYLAIMKNKSEIDLEYFLKVKESFLVEDGLASTGHMDHVEYCLMTYEQIGILSTIGLSKLWYAEVGMFAADEIFDLSRKQLDDAEVIADLLGQLINNNPASLYPKLDEHCIEINLALILLYETGKFETMIKWLGGIINYLSVNYSLYGFFPLWITDYDRLAEVSTSREKQAPESSILMVVLAEWSLILKQLDLYFSLRYIAEELVTGINLQLWKPDTDSEQFFYKKNAMRDSGEAKVNIHLYKNHREYLMEMTEELVLWKDNYQITFVRDGMWFVGYYAFRHFRTYVFPFMWRRYLSSPFCFSFPAED